MKRAARQAATSAPNSGTAASMTTKVAVKSHGRFFTPPGDAHLVAQRPQHVVAREQAEKIRERPAHRGGLVAADRNEARKPGCGRIRRHRSSVSGALGNVDP